MNFKANIRFSDTTILIKHAEGKQVEELKDWNWVKEIGVLRDSIILKINQSPKMSLYISKEDLTDEAFAYFTLRSLLLKS